MSSTNGSRQIGIYTENVGLDALEPGDVILVCRFDELKDFVHSFSTQWLGNQTEFFTKLVRAVDDVESHQHDQRVVAPPQS